MNIVQMTEWIARRRDMARRRWDRKCRKISSLVLFTLTVCSFVVCFDAAKDLGTHRLRTGWTLFGSETMPETEYYNAGAEG